MSEPQLCDLSVSGRQGISFPDPDVPLSPLPDGLLRQDLPLPELSELDVIRHYTRLSQLNYSIDSGYYPLQRSTKISPGWKVSPMRIPSSQSKRSRATWH
jgi:glycine dehydrogenase subunit 2